MINEYKAICFCETSSIGPHWRTACSKQAPAQEHDPINSPAHYTAYPVEVIELTEHLNFCLGNVVKYVARADHKGNALEDLRKAAWYLTREIQRREQQAAGAERDGAGT